jgi:hypothetical protein
MESILDDEMQAPCAVKNGQALALRKKYFAKTFALFVINF